MILNEIHSVPKFSKVSLYENQLIKDVKNMTDKSNWKLKSKQETNNPVKVTNKQVKWFFQRDDVIWLNLISVTILHITSLYAFLTFPYIQKWKVFAWCLFMGVCAGFGVTGGVHRLWAHRSYKAKLPLRIILLCCYMVAGQYSIKYWVRDHRVHHKYTETDADPHNTNRGFWFSHVGWLTLKRHPDVINKGKLLDLSDIENDPVVAFEEKYFPYLKLMFCFVLPILVPVYILKESWYLSIMSQIFIRYPLSLNFTWSVNSFAHMFGNKPYDKKIQPSQNPFVSFVAMGEGWHNYHHVFPWDYKAAEIPFYYLNLTTLLIDLFAKIGWAYDLKEPSKELVEFVIKKRGDGTHERHMEISCDDKSS